MNNKFLEACVFIDKINLSLSTNKNIIATSFMYFNIYYSKYDINILKYDINILCLSCIFLSNKVNEYQNINNLNKIIKTYDNYNNNYNNIKNNILKFEFQLIELLGFTFDYKNPYNYLIKYINKINNSINIKKISIKIKQISWNFINDSLYTNLCLLYKPNLITIACIYLATDVLNDELKNIIQWFDLFKCNKNDIINIINIILIQYDTYLII